MAKRKAQHKNAYFLPHYRIETNLHYISSLLSLNKTILDNYIQPVSEDQSGSQTSIRNAKKQSTNELLLFVTETLRYELPEHIKKVEEGIKERKYKLADSVVVKEVLNNFTGTIAT